jgi:hypothetical protein
MGFYSDYCNVTKQYSNNSKQNHIPYTPKILQGEIKMTNKIKMTLISVIALMILGCDQVTDSGNPFPEGEAAGLYVGEREIPEDLSAYEGSPLEKALSWIAENAESNKYYTVIIDKDETPAITHVTDVIHAAIIFYNSGAVTVGLPSNTITNVTVTLMGSGLPGMADYRINLSEPGYLVYNNITTLTLVLGKNITLAGRSDNIRPLVYFKGTELTMMDGCKITGNTNNNESPTAVAGGVAIDTGTFNMEGGEISGNTLVSTSAAAGTIAYTTYGGGGVFLGAAVFFNMSGGIIKNNTAINCYGGGVTVYAIAASTDPRVNITDGVIAGNSAPRGGGLYFYCTNSIFVKKGGGIIYGDNAPAHLKNTATDPEGGAAICLSGYNASTTPPHRRVAYLEKTVGAGKNLYAKIATSYNNFTLAGYVPTTSTNSADWVANNWVD